MFLPAISHSYLDRAAECLDVGLDRGLGRAAAGEFWYSMPQWGVTMTASMLGSDES